MPLVHHLRGGPLVDWITTHCPHLSEAAEATVQAAQAASTVRPARRWPREHYAMVGAIVGQRLADAIEPAPPYPALYGAVLCSALDMAAAGHLACQYPTHRHTQWSQEQRAAGVHLRPTPTGWWQILPAPTTSGHEDTETLLVRLLEQHRRAVCRLPLGQLADPSTEARLVPLYQLLQQLEAIYRGSTRLDALQQVATTGVVPVDQRVREDVLQILPHNQRALQQIRALAGGSADKERLGFAAPVLEPGWAEADLLVGPHPRGGYTLLDVKTVTTVDFPRVREWLIQTLAYALLDSTDRWQISRVGLWLPRQGLLVGWQLTELAATPGCNLTALRQQFTQLAAAVSAEFRL